MNYDIFLDESGLFLESSTDANEREKHDSDTGRKFPSQIAGVVCRQGAMTSGNAGLILKSACLVGGLEYTPRFHANEHRGKNGFPLFVKSLCTSLHSKKIQPVRLVNAEGVSFGDRVATYCNILAELLVRVCQQLELEGDSQVSLNVFAAKVVTEDDVKMGITILDSKEYLARIHELFGRVAIANGFSSSRFKWEVRGFELRSAREDHRLQLADVISYASHDEYSPLKKDADATEALVQCLAHFNWTFSCNETLALVRDLSRRESFGPALIALAERATAVGCEAKSLEQYNAMAADVAIALEALPPGMQRPQFQIVTGWLNQVAEQRHDLDSSLRCCRWIQAALCDRQSSASWPTDWLRLVSDTWALTACNHDANTIQGRAFADKIEASAPKLSSRWEFAEDLMFSFIVKAVHQIDCFEHQAAADRMASVVRYYEQLDGFFAAAFEGVFPEKVLSDLRARALGTQLQSEIGLLLTSKGDVDRCRAISDQAISEFRHEGDRSRQWQYRCELEAVVGDWGSARDHLAKSLGLTDASHDAIGNQVQKMPDNIGKAFVLLHWARIGSMSAVVGDRAESSAFLSAFLRTKAQHTPWCVGAHSHYPTHGILRHVAVATAGGGDSKATVESLSRLLKIVEMKPQPIFTMIQIAAHFQCAGLLLESDRKSAEKLILGDKKNVSVIDMIESLLRRVAGVQPMVEEITSSWRHGLESQSKGNLDAVKLLEMGRIVGY